MATAFISRPFFQGALDSLPMVLAAIPFGVLFGVLAPTNGIESWIAVAFSALVFAGSAQYVAIGLWANGTPAVLVIATTFIINLRHLLYALALVLPFKHLPKRKTVAMSFLLTDETFVTFNQRLQRGLSEADRLPYYLGSAIFMYSNWQLSTWAGLLAGNHLQGINELGLEFALVTAFLAMLTTMPKVLTNVVAAILGFTLAWYTRDWPYKTGIIFSVITAACVGAFAIPTKQGIPHD